MRASAAASAVLRDLSTVPADPAEGRARVLTALDAITRYDVGAEYRVVENEDRLLVAHDMTLIGDTWQQVRDDFVRTDFDLERHNYDPRALSRLANRFTLMGEAERRVPAFDRYYRPHGLQHQLRLLAFEGGRFVGWLGLIRAKDEAPFSNADRAAVDAIAPACADTLAVIASMERRQLRGVAPAELLFDAAGRLENATPGAVSWLTPDRRARLADMVRKADRSEMVAIGGALFVLRRLEGRFPRYLVHLRPAALPRRRRLLELTPRRRAIALYFASGATAKEIAETLGISSHTVRQHLKAIYRDLDVARRCELTRLVDDEGLS